MVNHIKEKVYEIIRIKGIWQETASLRTTREPRLPERQVFYPLFSFESVLFILCVHWCMLMCEVRIHCCIHRSKTHVATIGLKSQPKRTSRNRSFPFLGWMAFLCLLGSLDSVAFLASLTPIPLIAFKRNLPGSLWPLLFPSALLLYVPTSLCKLFCQSLSCAVL